MADLCLNVAFVARSTLYSSPGGDTVQIDRTAAYLRLSGLRVDIYTTDREIDYEAYDLFHYFNIIRPGDILYHIGRTDKPFVVSPIFVDYSEYERKCRGGMAGLVFRLVGNCGSEYLKCLLRWLKNGERIRSTRYWLQGHCHSIRYILQRCAAILPNSNSEYRRLRAAFAYKGSGYIVPCAVDLATFRKNCDQGRQANLILCVGRIEGRKNQLSLIRALKGSDYELVIIGQSSPNHTAYYEACKAAADETVRFVSHISQAALQEYYHRAKVHVLPSWFETAGLSSLEAAFCGCNIVVGDRGDVRDYFGEDAWYCDPGQIGSIRRAIDEAVAAACGNNLQQRIETEFNWANAASRTRDCYADLFPGLQEQT